MHGLIFVTWEHYLAERFGMDLLHAYRATIGETPSTAPLATHVYDDAILLAGVGAACQLTGHAADPLLRDYGRYFILNGLTSHRCAYLLEQVQNSRDLLLIMREAHLQMRRTPDGLTPPLFAYEQPARDELILIYDSPRQLCSLLIGAIEGAAERYGEQVQIYHPQCLKQGHAVCRFELRFLHPSIQPQATSPLLREKKQRQRELSERVLRSLPAHDGRTLMQLRSQLQVRPSAVLEALQHLQHAGLVSTTATQPGDSLTTRRFWRTPTSD